MNFNITNDLRVFMPQSAIIRSHKKQTDKPDQNKTQHEPERSCTVRVVLHMSDKYKENYPSRK